MVPKGVRIFAMGAALALAGGALSACSDDGTEGAGTSTTITIAPTSYVTREPVTTTTTGRTTPAKPGETSAAEQLYTVESGDYLALIAGKYEVSVEEIVNYNQWADGANHTLFAGDVIKIPPGAKIPEDDEGVTTDPPTDITDEDGTIITDPTGNNGNGNNGDNGTETTTGTTQATDNCEAGTYELVAGDYPIGVAQNFDVTLDQLNAANTGTEGYEAFYPGLEIVIPAGSDC